jgi:hypothetical protein
VFPTTRKKEAKYQQQQQPEIIPMGMVCVCVCGRIFNKKKCRGIIFIRPDGTEKNKN